MELKNFNRIQDTVLQHNVFDGIQSFPECGGIGIFIGTVRNHHEGRAVKALKYTAYAPVAEKMIRQIERDIQLKYGVSYVRVVHRIGALGIGDTAIIAMAYAPHRREAFEACEEAVERVKHEVPVWKEEFYMDGSSQFVEGCCIRKDQQNHSDQLSQLHVLTEAKTPSSHSHCLHTHEHPHGDDHHLVQKKIQQNANIYQWHL